MDILDIELFIDFINRFEGGQKLEWKDYHDAKKTVLQCTFRLLHILETIVWTITMQFWLRSTLPDKVVS